MGYRPLVALADRKLFRQSALRMQLARLTDIQEG